jgi:hypothetical protein
MTKAQKLIALKLELANAVIANEHENVINELLEEINEIICQDD